MIAIDLITYDIPPLVHTDTGEKHLFGWMNLRFLIYQY